MQHNMSNINLHHLNDRSFRRYMIDLLATSNVYKDQTCVEFKRLLASDMRDKVKQFFAYCSLKKLEIFLDIAKDEPGLIKDVCSLLSDQRISEVYDSCNSTNKHTNLQGVFRMEYLIRIFKETHCKNANLSAHDEEVLRRFIQALTDTRTSKESGWLAEQCCDLYQANQILIDQLIATFDKSEAGMQLINKLLAIYKARPIAETKRLINSSLDMLCNHGNLSLFYKICDCVLNANLSHKEDAFRQTERYTALVQALQTKIKMLEVSSNAEKERQAAEKNQQRIQTNIVIQSYQMKIAELEAKNVDAQVIIRLNEAELVISAGELNKLRQSRDVFLQGYQYDWQFLNDNVNNLPEEMLSELRDALQNKQRVYEYLELKLRDKQKEHDDLANEVAHLKQTTLSNYSKIQLYKELVQQLSRQLSQFPSNSHNPNNNNDHTLSMLAYSNVNNNSFSVVDKEREPQEIYPRSVEPMLPTHSVTTQGMFSASSMTSTSYAEEMQQPQMTTSIARSVHQ